MQITTNNRMLIEKAFNFLIIFNNEEEKDEIIEILINRGTKRNFDGSSAKAYKSHSHPVYKSSSGRILLYKNRIKLLNSDIIEFTSAYDITNKHTIDYYLDDNYIVLSIDELRMFDEKMMLEKYQKR